MPRLREVTERICGYEFGGRPGGRFSFHELAIGAFNELDGAAGDAARAMLPEMRTRGSVNVVCGHEVSAFGVRACGDAGSTTEVEDV